MWPSTDGVLYTTQRNCVLFVNAVMGDMLRRVLIGCFHDGPLVCIQVYILS
jgi:hypothetical protein